MRLHQPARQRRARLPAAVAESLDAGAQEREALLAAAELRERQGEAFGQLFVVRLERRAHLVEGERTFAAIGIAPADVGDHLDRHRAGGHALGDPARQRFGALTGRRRVSQVLREHQHQVR